MTGSRKLRQTREAQLVLLAGFLANLIAPVPEAIFALFVFGVSGNLGWFSWANVKVHQAGNEGVVNGSSKTG